MIQPVTARTFGGTGAGAGTAAFPRKRGQRAADLSAAVRVSAGPDLLPLQRCVSAAAVASRAQAGLVPGYGRV
jgi:hypothetical protein